MADFDRLNRETREFNARNVDRFNRSTPPSHTSAAYFNRLNNETYKAHNGQYSSKFY